MSIESRPNIVQNFEIDLNSILDLYRAHDAVHPDKNECGGVGRCLMMRAECESERGVEEYLRAIAQLGHLRIEMTA